MLGYVGINAAITNNSLESSWNQMKIATKPVGYVLHVHSFLRALFWHLQDKTMSRSKELEDDPSADPFRSAPVPFPAQWHNVQMWKTSVLDCIKVVEGNMFVRFIFLT